MPRFALLQDGSDVGRHARSDVIGVYEACAVTLTKEIGVHFSFEPFYDQTAASLFDGLSVDKFECIVFASNAMLSDEVLWASERHLSNLYRFVEDGGGIVVLHQWRDSLEPFLTKDLLPTLKSRLQENLDQVSARAVGRDDGLLHFPFNISLETIHDSKRDAAPDRLFFKVMSTRSLPPKLKPVLDKPGEGLLLARTDDHVNERVVISTIPLDWQRRTELICNIILFACSGQPRRLVWRGQEAGGEELLHRWLALDGSSALRRCPAESDQTPPPDAWLLGAPDSHLELFFAPGHELATVRARPEVVRFLNRGGTIVSALGDSQPGAVSLTAFIGSYTERVLASRLYGELRAEMGWRNVESAFNIRNIVCALDLLWNDSSNRTPNAIPVAEVDSLRTEICTRLSNPMHQDDLGSSLALAQTAVFLDPASPLNLRLLDWLATRQHMLRPDERIQALAVLALWSRTPNPNWLGDVAQSISSWGKSLSSAAPIVRVLDTVAVLAQGALLSNDSESAARIAATVCEVLETHPAEPRVGWISVEATADIVRGLLALLDVVPAGGPGQAALSTHVATGTDVLRRSLANYRRNPDGVARLARVVHALVVVERRFPIGLQRLATLRWPEQMGPAAATALLPLIDHLGITNTELREENRRLRQQVTAAALGRGTATVAVTALLLAATVAVILIVADVSSFWGIAGGLAASATALLTLLAGTFSLLERWQLLARPAKRALAAAEKVAPVAQVLTKMRGKG